MVGIPDAYGQVPLMKQNYSGDSRNHRRVNHQLQKVLSTQQKKLLIKRIESSFDLGGVPGKKVWEILSKLVEDKYKNPSDI